MLLLTKTNQSLKSYFIMVMRTQFRSFTKGAATPQATADYHKTTKFHITTPRSNLCVSNIGFGCYRVTIDNKVHEEAM
jgi:hypothetical protein